MKFISNNNNKNLDLNSELLNFLNKYFKEIIAYFYS